MMAQVVGRFLRFTKPNTSRESYIQVAQMLYRSFTDTGVACQLATEARRKCIDRMIGSCGNGAYGGP